VHHETQFTLQQGIDALDDVIHHLETFDVTTIRASTPMYLLARRIKAMGIKMVLTGEGSDEIFGGYLYFHKAPDAREFHAETIRKLDALYKYDCLRANKSLASWGIEGRVLIEFTISKSGSVKNPKVIAYEPSTIFNKAAIKAVLQWKYNPKIEEGKAVERSGVRVRLKFELKDG